MRERWRFLTTSIAGGFGLVKGEDLKEAPKPPHECNVQSKADLYKCFPLRRKNAIRLLRIENWNATPEEPLICELKVMTLDSEDLPQYIACSYTWGEPIFDKSVSVNDFPFTVTAHLEAALRRFRRCNWNWYWVDQICINQADLGERSKQVELMGRIYSGCLWTFVWLGDTDKDMEKVEQLVDHLVEAFQKIVELGKRFLPESPEDNIDVVNVFETMPTPEFMLKSGLSPSRVEAVFAAVRSPEALSLLSYLHEGPGADEGAWVAYYELFTKPWWSRVWVQQEVGLAGASRSLWFCGHNDATSNLQELFHSTATLRFFDSVVQLNNSRVTEYAHRLRVSSLHRSSEEFGIYCLYRMCAGQFAIFSALLSAYRYTSCSDVRDRIYAVRALFVNCADLPVPDYTKSVEFVYRHYASHLIRTDAALEVIRMAGFSRQSIPGLPSWCPDWSTGLVCDPANIGPTSTDSTSMVWPDLKRLMNAYNVPAVGSSERFRATSRARGSARGHVEYVERRVAVFGCVFDTIRELGPRPQITAGTGRSLHWIDRLRWLLKSFQVLQRTSTAYNDATRYELFCRMLMLTEVLRTVPPPTSKQFKTAFGVFPEGPLEDCAAEWDSSHGFLRETEVTELMVTREVRLAEDFQTVVKQVIQDRRVCVTQRGYIGLVPAMTIPGDRVCQFQGAGSPGILRHHGTPSAKANQTSYWFVGNGYFLDLMDEQACKFNLGLQEWIILV